MANLDIIPDIESFDWQVSSLGSPFSSSNYIRVGITRVGVTNGSSSVFGIIATKDAPSGGTSYSSGYKYLSYESGTFTFYAFAQAKNGLYYTAGSKTVTIKSRKIKPSYFSWYSMYSGSPIVSASEWNSFTDRINEWRKYKDMNPYFFTRAYSGNSFYAYIFNEAINSLSSMTYVNVSTKYRDDVMYASDFNRLTSAMNNIN